MCERKVLNKYYPPDFDPEKLAARKFMLRNKTGSTDKRQRERKRQMQVRMMFPFTMCCEHCGEFNYIGKKFNSRVQRLKGDEYLGLPVWRFYGKCPNCSGEFSFKTDPKNRDYVLETGGTRTYEPLKDAEQAEKALKNQLEDINDDVIKSLEHKTYNTANELAALEQLDDLKRMNKRLFEREKITDQTLAFIEKKNKPKPANEVELDDDDMKELEAFRRMTNKDDEDLCVEEFTDEELYFSEDEELSDSNSTQDVPRESSRDNKRPHVSVDDEPVSKTAKSLPPNKTGAFASNLAPRFQVKKKNK